MKQNQSLIRRLKRKGKKERIPKWIKKLILNSLHLELGRMVLNGINNHFINKTTTKYGFPMSRLDGMLNLMVELEWFQD